MYGEAKVGIEYDPALRIVVAIRAWIYTSTPRVFEGAAERTCAKAVESEPPGRLTGELVLLYTTRTY